MSEEKRGRGRPRKYPKEVANDGAPVLSVRLDPVVYLHIQARPEGARAYIEQLVREDLASSGPVPSLDRSRATTNDT